MAASIAARCGRRAAWRCAASRLAEAVVGVDAGRVEGVAVLGEHVGEEGLARRGRR